MADAPIFLAGRLSGPSSPLFPVDDPFLVHRGSSPSPLKLYCAYDGSSMHPTLTARDLLEIVPYPGSIRPEPGDVILCSAPVPGRYVVHRITASTPAGFKTRGDNSSSVDPWLLAEKDIIGRVAAVHRHGGSHFIRGGKAGLLQAARCHLRRRSISFLRTLLRPL